MILTLVPCLKFYLFINLLVFSIVHGQYFTDPYASTTANRGYGYRYGSNGNYGPSKYPYPYNGQYYDPQRPVLGAPDPNDYWRYHRDRYSPGKNYPTNNPGTSSYPAYSPYGPPPPPPPSPLPSPGMFGQPLPPPPSPQLSAPSYESKYNSLPGPANFADTTVTFDHRFGWVPRYPHYAVPPSIPNYHTQSPYSYPSHRVARAVAELRGSDKITGTISFEQEENEHVIIRGKVLGLPPGAHGMHILEKPMTGNDCSSGGDHYNPQKTEHGGKHDWVRHVGDLGNIFADRDGIAYFDLTDQIISLTGGYSVLNRTIVITEKPDDLGRSGDAESKRTGNSGTPIACGLIQLAKF